MRQAYGKIGGMVLAAQAEAMFAARNFFIVERSTPVAGTGTSVTAYLKAVGEWSEDEKDAMRFPQKILAESYARRFKGVVVERAP